MSSFSGADRVYGHDGPDQLFGGQGRDRVYGGPGDDFINVLDERADLEIDCGDGIDEVYVDDEDVGVTNITNCENGFVVVDAPGI